MSKSFGLQQLNVFFSVLYLQGQRIKLRKSLKRLRENQHKTVDEHVETGGHGTTSDDNEDGVGEENDAKRPKHPPRKPVFSSLFRNNPEIPDIERYGIFLLES